MHTIMYYISISRVWEWDVSILSARVDVFQLMSSQFPRPPSDNKQLLPQTNLVFRDCGYHLSHRQNKMRFLMPTRQRYLMICICRLCKILIQYIDMDSCARSIHVYYFKCITCTQRRA